MEEFSGEGATDFFPERPYVHVHRIAKRIEVPVPDMLNNHGATQHRPGVPHEILEEFELFLTEANGCSGTDDGVGHGVTDEIRKFELRCRDVLLTAEQRSDPCEQLFEGKWFGEVIVRAVVDDVNLSHRVSVGGKNNNRRDDVVLAEIEADLGSVSLGKHEIKHDDVVGVLLRQLQAKFAVPCAINGKVCSNKAAAYEACDSLFVFND